ncbi:transposase [Photorhabdus temperata]|nr:transposase [Photorhabdus temperata]
MDKGKFSLLWERIILKKYYLIETMFITLRNISHIEYLKHRSPISFLY